VQTNWKTRLGSRRTLGRVIRFELLLTLVFAAASLAMLLIPENKMGAGRVSAATAVVLAESDTGFVYPFPAYQEIAASRESLYSFATVRREEATLLILEEEPEEVEQDVAVVEKVVEEKYEPPPPLPDLDGLMLVGTLTGADGESIAIVRDDNLGQTVYVKAGDELNGATVQNIANNAVRVILGDQEDELLGMSYLMEGSGD